MFTQLGSWREHRKIQAAAYQNITLMKPRQCTAGKSTTSQVDGLVMVSGQATISQMGG